MMFGSVAPSADSDVTGCDVGEERPHLPLRQVQQDLRLCLGVFLAAGRWKRVANGRAPGRPLR